LKVGDEVAVMPAIYSPPHQVIEIAKVTYAGEIFVRLSDGRLFATIGGRGLDNKWQLAMVTDAHRLALQHRATIDKSTVVH
jgi:hypothetical protein